jgi:dipeptidyl aminopeptidase/acylaminoacyl peptidase
MKAPYIIVIAFLLCQCYPHEGKNNTHKAKHEKLHPLSIEALRKRAYLRSRITIEKKVEELRTHTRYIVSYVSEGLKLYALMNVPAGNNSAFPAVIINHGYIPPDAYSTTGSYKTIADRYARNGFLVFKPDYRGHDESEGKDSGPFRTIHYSIDVLNLIASMSGVDEWDGAHLFLYGHSMGGEVSLRVLEVVGNINAASLWAPVSAAIPENTLYFIRQGSYKNAEAYLNALHGAASRSDYTDLSPVEHTAYIKAEIVLHHGTDDEDVPFDWSLSLIKAFEETGVKVTFYRHPGDNHNLSRFDYPGIIDKDIAYFKTLIHKGSDATGN